LTSQQQIRTDFLNVTIPTQNEQSIPYSWLEKLQNFNEFLFRDWTQGRVSLTAHRGGRRN
jgi:hypothetical protein